MKWSGDGGDTPVVYCYMSERGKVVVMVRWGGGEVKWGGRIRGAGGYTRREWRRTDEG